MTLDQLKRRNLGFLENVGPISLARYPDRSPAVNWYEAIDKWAIGEERLKKIEFPFGGLWSTFYVCNGSLPLHVDILEENALTYGMIVSNSHDLIIKTKNVQLPAQAGDIYALNPNEDHGAETEGLFVFAARDLKYHSLPTVEKARRLFLRDIQIVAENLRKAA